VSISRRVFFTKVRARERWIWLIRRRRSELRMRLIADFVFAKAVLLPSFPAKCAR
jgi:hypothetical protein